MFCRNCQQDTGNKSECPYCGYCPALDDEGAAPQLHVRRVLPRPVRITLNKINNGKATASFILSFFGAFIVPGIISVILALGGLLQAKRCRSGRAKAIIALVIDLIWVIVYCFVFKYAMGY